MYRKFAKLVAFPVVWCLCTQWGGKWGVLPVDALGGCASGCKGCCYHGGSHCRPGVGIWEWKTKTLGNMTRELNLT